MRLSILLLALVTALTITSVVPAQTYKKLPPAGIAISRETRGELTSRVAELDGQMRRAADLVSHSETAMADVQVLTRAVELAFRQNLFFKESELDDARTLLKEAERRLERLRDGKVGLELLGLSRSAADQPQLLVGGFRSRIDDSIQPYGLVVPAGYQPGDSPYRVDVWLHGRGDTKTEIPFLIERMTKPGRYTPEKTFVLHPFGRHCNAFKFAGEADVYEALDHVATIIPVDRERVSIRGFSMGGAGCWHLAVHDPSRWFAANPGAGFVDTIVYQGWSKQSPFEIDDTRRKLLNLYDVLPWVTNLSNTKVVAYSGEVDKQKQAADRVIEAAKANGLRLDYVIGEAMGHKIDAASAAKIDAMMSSWAEEVRPSPRRKIDFVTYTLRYNRVDWLSITGLSQHWVPSRVRAELVGNDRVNIRTEGVTRLELDFHQSGSFDGGELKVDIDGDRLLVPDQSDRPGLSCKLIRDDGWYVLEGPDAGLRKRPGLQGPIDDAFCDRFLFVIPSRPASHGVIERWVQRELEYAKNRWRRLMRGEVREVLDTELTNEQIQNNHLICFGDYQSNQYLRGIRAQLPIQWTDQTIRIGSSQFDPSRHVAVYCYPNPRNSERYLVVNSGMTFREFSNVSNSRQIAMLPDWAVIDVSVESDDIFPGRIAEDGFFDEQWQWKPNVK